MSRLAQLYKRRERLIEANNRQGYCYTKTDKYFKLLLLIRKEIAQIENDNRKQTENSPEMQFLKATKGLNGQQILILLTKKTNGKS